MGKELFFRASIFFYLFVLFCFPTYVPAAEPVAFGEIKATGDVRMESSTGKWGAVRDAYPLLKSTKLRTTEGIVGITTREGSRFDISKNTEVVIESANGSYKINLTVGTVSFSVTPSTSVIILTKDADISVSRQIGGYFSLVAGPGVPGFANAQGIIVSGSKGTLIRSLAGKMHVTPKSGQARILNAGESLYAAAGGVPAGASAAASMSAADIAAKQIMITGAFVTAGTLTSIETFRGEGFKSPSGF
ncbi:MAG: hypothetical protein AB1442_04545 [Nitrospirota bacterium]